MHGVNVAIEPQPQQSENSDMQEPENDSYETCGSRDASEDSLDEGCRQEVVQEAQPIQRSTRANLGVPSARFG